MLTREGDLDSPGAKLAQYCGYGDAFKVGVNSGVAKGTVLGAIAGVVTSSGDFETSCMHDLQQQHPKVSAFDLLGSRHGASPEDPGGFVKNAAGGEPHEDDVLCLDDSVCRNILSFIQDCRDDVHNPKAASTRQPNVCLVEVYVQGWPMHLAVAVEDIEAGAELLWDAGESYWIGWEHKMARVKSIQDLNKQLNKMMDRLKHKTDESATTDGLLGPTATQNQQRGEQMEAFRKAALLIEDQPEDQRFAALKGTDKMEKRIIPLYAPGTLHEKPFLLMYPNRSSTQRKELVSGVQTIVNDDSVRFFKGGSQDADPACAKLNKIQFDHGDVIMAEALRARKELDKYSGQLVPWDKAQGRPTTPAEVLLLLSVQVFKKSGFPEGVEPEDADWEANVDGDGGVVALKNKETDASLARKLTYFRSMHKELLNVKKPGKPQGSNSK